ncbi:ribonuclease E [Teredinibacter turnerae T7901]|uniref:Ribonuclease E n=1 Tax=Teredinibacter turnerae (strain ATCC 39867 / T7901) TaxID=377629 RepID=C5BU48_TERTT|nr:ribonuclease E [Teredinibacter turnerae]ACR11393.1 ribonuclease E [Teredinibacter turnerae T7901]
MKRMLINATQPEELRVALVDGQWLYDLDIENRLKEQRKANIYKGKITRIEPSLEAAFVEYDKGRNGFLPLKEISREYFLKQPNEIDGRIRIKDVVKEGMEVIVQVDKEERGNKGAALTTFISLAGRYLVLMPNNPRAGGISRRIDGDDRSELKDALSQIEIPNGMGIIVRTAGVGRSAEELQWDMNYLTTLWNNIQEAANQSTAPAFLFQESNVIIRAIRDYLRPDIGEVIVDDIAAYNQAADFVQMVMPNYRSKVKLYEKSVPLFNHYQIEGQIETAFEREVKLPSGGSIVIDVTEALVSIDINSSRATKGGDIEETALQTNLEAADEIARQLRLRDMGGLVVIDFIDMQPVRNQRAVENRVRDALKMDRARVQVGRISRFGLLEMSRQRLRPSLGETTSKVCPRCSGQGTIRGTKSIALSILRLVEEEAQKERSAEIRAVVPVPVATYLLNEKRKSISDIENRHQTRVTVLPNTEMVTPHYEVTRLRDDDDTSEISYTIELNHQEDQDDSSAPTAPVAMPKPVVQQLAPSQPAPEPVKQAPAKTAEGPSLIARIIDALKSLFAPEEEAKPATKGNQRSHQKKRNANTGNRNNRNRKPRDRDRDGDETSDNRKQQRDARSDSGKRDSNNRDNNNRDSNSRDNNGRDNNRNDRRRSRRRKDESGRSSESDTQVQASVDNTSASEDKPARRPANRRGRPQERQRGPLPEVEAGLQQADDGLDTSEELLDSVENLTADTDQENTPAKEGGSSRRRRRSRGRRGERNADSTSENSPELQETQTDEANATPENAEKPVPEATSTINQLETQLDNADAALSDALSELEGALHEARQEHEANAVREAAAAKALLSTAPADNIVAEAETSPETNPAPEADTAPETATAKQQPQSQNAPDSETSVGASPDTANDSSDSDTEIVESAEVQVEAATEEDKPADTAPTPNVADAPSESAAGDAVEIAETVEADSVEPAESAPVVAQDEAAAPASSTNTAIASDEPSEPAKHERASNDPRYMPKPVVNVQVISVNHEIRMGRPLDTSEPANIVRNPRDLQRAPNDPRRTRKPAPTEPSAAEN